MKFGTIVHVTKEQFQKIHEAEDKWNKFCELFLHDERFPTLVGGLDYIIKTRNQITFNDIGVNYKDNTFTLRINKKTKK